MHLVAVGFVWTLLILMTIKKKKKAALFTTKVDMVLQTGQYYENSGNQPAGYDAAVVLLFAFCFFSKLHFHEIPL